MGQALTDDELDLAARRITMSCCLYYRYAVNVLSDGEYDKLCRTVSDNFERLSTFRQWQLGSADEIRSSGFHVKITAMAEGGALAWFRKVNGCLPVDFKHNQITDDAWKFDEERKVRWLNCG